MGTFEDVHKCVICKGDIEVRRNVNGIAYWNRGHNAWPGAKGYCCQKCEDKKVIPRRKLELLLNQKNGEYRPLVLSQIRRYCRRGWRHTASISR